jgi:hypothetical protein
MDFIEIRMRHNLPTASSNQSLPPILMRGFVPEVARDQAMGLRSGR